MKTLAISLAILITTSCTSSAITIDKATIVNKKIVVHGSDVEPYSTIYWMNSWEEPTTQATSEGKFHFSSEILPTRPFCRGEIMTSNGDEISFKVDSCKGKIVGFYSSKQSIKSVEPGEYGSVISTCSPGDYAVSGNYRIFAGSSFKIKSFSFMRNGTNGLENWVLSGTNTGNDQARIGVSAQCAEVQYQY